MDEKDIEQYGRVDERGAQAAPDQVGTAGQATFAQPASVPLPDAKKIKGSATIAE
jgi:hypothetical protein